jgi:hypothetical protein
MNRTQPLVTLGRTLIEKTPLWLIIALAAGNTIAVLAQLKRGVPLEQHGYALNALFLWGLAAVRRFRTGGQEAKPVPSVVSSG